MKHLIFDFETMGQDPSNCAAIDVSAMVFDWDRFTSNPYTCKDINSVRRFKLSVSDQVQNYDFKVEQDVLDFWESQPKEVKRNIAPKKTDLTVKEFVQQFHDFLIDAAKAKKAHMEEYLKFYLVRDTRTWIDAKLNFPKKNGFVIDEWKENFKAHDSSWDTLIDVLRLQKLHRIEFDLEDE